MKINRREWLYIPNLLTLARLVLFPIPVIFIIRGNDLAALIALAIGIATDVLDGYLARRLNQISDLGKLLDPLSDKLAVAALAIVLHIYRGFPFWAMALIIGRDLIILVVGAFHLKSKLPFPTSNQFGKLTAFAWSLLLLSYLTPFEIARSILLVVAPILVPISAYLYLRAILKAHTQAPQG
jgi:CDP-diacylglycerol--glycerol-3-phosphate 3-phosphatidyltransferase